MAAKALTDNIAAIRAWIDDKDTANLSEDQKLTLKRWEFAYDQLKTQRITVVISRIMKMFAVSHSTARKDVENCQKIFAPTLRLDNDFIRNFIVEDAMLQIQVARESLNHRAWQLARADLIKIIQMSNDKEDLDPEMLGNNAYYITVNLGDKAKIIDLAELDKAPRDKKIPLNDILFQEVNQDQAKTIMNS
jgi:hypothetical protein